MEASVTVNGRARPLGRVGGHVTLLDWLRDVGFTGSKEGCAEGECGACAVLVARPGRRRSGPGGPRSTPVSCRRPALEHQEVVTAEGLGDARSRCTRCSGRWRIRGGSQCGYCTPGFVCSMAAEFYRSDRRRRPDGDARRAAEPGRPRGRQAAAERATVDGPDPTAPGDGAGPRARAERLRPARPVAETCAAARVTGRSGTPPTRCGAPCRRPVVHRMRNRPRAAAPSTRIDSSHGGFVRPGDLDEALALLADDPDARLVAGSTDWGVELNIRHARAGLTIGIDRLPELRHLEIGDDCDRHRRRDEPDRGGARARRPGPAAGRTVSAVRVPADPQRRDHRWQPGHRLADRRHPPALLALDARSCWRPAAASARCRWPTTSPATGSP